MKFLVDEQLPLVLVRALAATGFDATHIFECGLGGADDPEIWAYACAENRVMVTRDSDFVRIQRASATSGGCVLWIRLGNCTNDVLLAAVIPNLPIIERLFDQGERLVEIA